MKDESLQQVSWLQLTKVVRNEKGQKRYQCTVCQKVGEKTAHVSHVMKHINMYPFHCPEPGCSKAYSSKHELKRHLPSHLSDRQFLCEICSARFKSKDNLYYHKMTHNIRFHCQFCSGGFYSKFELLRHEKKHAPGKKLRKCDICEKSFSTVVMLNNHKFKEHDIRVPKKRPKGLIKKLKGPEYSDFETEKSLELTERIKDEKGKVSYKCKECGHISKFKKDHFSHVLKHTGECPFKCEFDGCSKAYKVKSYLKRHLDTHFKERKFVCDVCKATFKDKYYLKSHSKIHENIFNCRFCSGTFVSKSKLKNHEFRHENNKTLKSCDLCEKFFLNGRMLNNHKFNEHGVNKGIKNFKKLTFEVEELDFDNIIADENEETEEEIIDVE